MRVTSTTLALVLFCAAAPAQIDKYITSPPGFLTTEAGELNPQISTSNRMSRWFGGYQAAEFQIFDDHLRGGGIKFIKQMDYRSDTRGHSATSSMGRTWTSVTVSLSDGDLNGPLSKTFTANATSTPTAVFNSSMSWPTVTANQYPNPQPNDWGVVSIPFNSQFVTAGQTSILQHFKFSGGTLANSGSWTGSTGVTYLLDAHFNDSASTGFYYINGGDQCVDGYFGGTDVAYAYVYSQTFSSNLALVPADVAGQVVIDASSNRTAPLRPVLVALGLNGANVPMPMVTCTNDKGNTMTQSLRVDLAVGTVIGGIARYDGRFAVPIKAPYNPAMDGARLYMQAGWEDSVTGNLALSRMAYNQVAAQPAGKFLCLYTNGPSTGTAASITAWMDRIPVLRYTYQ